MTYHPTFQCHVISIEYDFAQRIGHLKKADGNCCDMDGCVTFFEHIDPNVRQIQTVAGSAMDTVYTRTPADWRAARAA